MEPSIHPAPWPLPLAAAEDAERGGQTLFRERLHLCRIVGDAKGETPCGKGGEGIAYHDSETANQGGQYRTSDSVDVEATSDTGGGNNVGWTRTDEWLEYTVNVATSGSYTLQERVASGATTGSFRVEFNGVDKTGSIAVPNTGGWQSYQTLSQTVSLNAGTQIMRVYFLGNDSNLNSFTLSANIPSNTATVTRTTHTCTFTHVLDTTHTHNTIACKLHTFDDTT